MSDYIKVYLSNSKCFVWDAEDAGHLREEWHIVGCLVGCLPRFPRQNNHLGLPLQLSSEEVTLLLEKDVIKLVKDADAGSTPTDEQIDAFERMRKDSYEQQVELFREERRREIKQNLPSIIKGKKEKLKKDRQGEEIDDEEIEEVSVDKIPIAPVPEKHSLIQLFTENPLRETQEIDVEWTFPHTDQEKLRYRVYKDLWEKGHFLTSGSKFGGDFLVYPGDPSRFHSHYIAICMPYKRKCSALDIVSMGRLGSNVRKTVVMCSEDDENQIKYTSLQWTGIS